MISLSGILDCSNKGLMIGNSSLGAIVFGERYLSISLDKIDLWDERMPEEFSNPLFNYKELEKLLNKDYKKAFELFDQCYLHPYPTKINAGIIKTNIPVSNNDHSVIDTDNAEVLYESRNGYLKAYVDANKDVIVLESNKPILYEISLPMYFNKKIEDKGLDYPEPICIKDNGFLVVKQAMYDDKSFHIVIYSKNNYLFVTVSKSKNIEKSKELLVDYALNIKKNYEKHLKIVHQFNAQSSIQTPDSQINNFYNLGKYFFYANSSKKYPVSTQGIWTQYNDELPPWKSDLHNDLNVQLSYEPFFKTGNYQEIKTLLNFLVKNKKAFQKNAKDFLHSDGLFIPGVMSQKCQPLGGWPQYSLSLCCQIWLINAFTFYFEYSKDEEYLKNIIFPFLQEMEIGLRTHLKNDQDGKLVLGFHSSPEFFEDNHDSIFNSQTNFEITCLTFLYTKLAYYSDVLGIDGKYYHEQLQQIRPLYRNSNNELMVSGDQDFTMSHRHFSHMLCYKNVPIFDFYQNKDLLKKDLEKLISETTDKWVGFSFTEYADFLALADEGERAYQNLKIFINNFTHSNGFHMNNDYKECKYSKMDCYVFTLEANFSFVNAVNDMLLHNFENKVTIFPALPSSFIQKGISFKNLRIHGDHKVSAKRKNNKLSFLIKMNNEDVVILENNIKENPSFLVDGKEISFDAKIGDFIKIKAANSIKYN